MLQAKVDNFLIGQSTDYIAQPTKPFIAQWLASLKYIMAPEDTSTEVVSGQQVACKTIYNVTSSTIKIIFWFTVSISFSLLLGQLT